MSETAPLPEPNRRPQRLVFFAAFFFTVQLGALFLLGTKNEIIPRAVANVPHLALVAAGNQLIALGDPTLFVRPHAQDFSAKIWLGIPTNRQPDFRWQEPPRWLALNAESLAVNLADLSAVDPAEALLDFNTSPELELPSVAVEKFFPVESSVRFAGGLARRKLLAPVIAPVLAVNEVVEASRVQVLVGTDGAVISSVLLASSGLAEADQTALQLARAAEFAPADGLMFGEIVFQWHTTAQ